jgi:hypothetical protein
MLPNRPLQTLGTESSWIPKYLPKALLSCHSLLFLLAEVELEARFVTTPGPNLFQVTVCGRQRSLEAGDLVISEYSTDGCAVSRVHVQR